MGSCFFIGSSETSKAVQKALKKAVKRHITEYGVTEFIVGGNGQFDIMAAEAVMAAKQEHLNITLSILSPYTQEEQQTKLPQGYDKLYYPSSEDKAPKWYAMVKLNRNIIDLAEYLIIYNWQEISNTRELVKYAQEREKIGFLRIEDLKN